MWSPRIEVLLLAALTALAAAGPQYKYDDSLADVRDENPIIFTDTVGHIKQPKERNVSVQTQSTPETYQPQQQQQSIPETYYQLQLQNKPAPETYQPQKQSDPVTYQLQKQPTPAPYQPQRQSTPEIYQPQRQPAPENYQPQRQPTPENYQPQRQPTLENYQPQRQPTPENYQPQRQPATENYQPQRQPTPENYQPQRQPAPQLQRQPAPQPQRQPAPENYQPQRQPAPETYPLQRKPAPDIYQQTNTQQFSTGEKSYEEPQPEKVKYYGSQVWNIVVDNPAKLTVVSGLSRSQDVASWGGDHTAVDFMVRPEKQSNVANILRRSNITYSVVIEDLQRNIDAENPPLSEHDQDLQDRKGHRMTWQQYHRLADIHGFLDYLAITYPSLCSVMTIGKSHQGRDLKMLRISNGRPNNKAVLIDGGIHAREWISPATVTYIINEFAENFDDESDTIRNMDWYFIPVLNPDGYEYTHTVDRLWRKNRSGFGPCTGTDLNRNFGYKWGGQGTSKNPCSEVYPGKYAFSEPESKALQDFVMRSSAKFKLYATYHSYGEYILYPWGYDKVVPEDYKDLDRVGNDAAQAIIQAGGAKYRVGASSLVLYPASGGSDDWAKAIAGIKYTYTVELSDRGRYGFVLPASYISKVAKESLAALRVMAEAANLA